MDGQPIEPSGPAAMTALEVLAERLQGLAVAAGWTVATAESCTGGMIADTLTDIPGSSGYLLGGIVAYADEVKARQLDVPAEVIAAHGAVSAQVARAMALGARQRFGATFAVSVTGIAGPDGGSEAKPVGLTYVALAGPVGVEVRRFVWTGDRAANKSASTRAALSMLIDAVEGAAPTPAGTR
jgi:PncC family amidohydrolase